MDMYEFVWENEDNAEVTVCIDYQILEPEPGYQQEIEIHGIQVHVDGMGWTMADPGMEDKIANYVYTNLQESMLEEAQR